MSALAVLLLFMNQTPPPPRESPLAISFFLTPLLREPGGAPKLQVMMENTGARALEVMRFESDACFAHFFLALPLTLPDGSKPEAAGCPIRSWPGAKGKLAGGAREQRVLDLAAVFPSVKWTRGRYALQPRWNPAPLDAYFDGAFAWRANQHSRNADSFELLPSLGQVRVERGQEVTLPDGARLSFLANGHKRTLVDGPPSPLIIHGAFAAPGKKTLAPFEVHLEMEETRVFRLLGGFAFELVKHEYDGWMELRYFGRTD